MLAAAIAWRHGFDRLVSTVRRHGGRDLGDRAHLRRQVGGDQVHVAGQVLPSAAAPGTCA
jgi:hypothetical protein